MQCPWVVSPTVHLAVVVRQEVDRSPAPSAGGPGVGVDVARLEQAGQVMVAATVEFSCIRLQRSEAQNLDVAAGSAVQVVAAATATGDGRRRRRRPMCYGVVVKMVVVVVLVHGNKDGGDDEQGDEEADRV